MNCKNLFEETSSAIIFIVLFFPWWDSTFLGAAADQEYNVPIDLIVVQAQTYSLSLPTIFYHILETSKLTTGDFHSAKHYCKGGPGCVAKI